MNHLYIFIGNDVNILALSGWSDLSRIQLNIVERVREHHNVYHYVWNQPTAGGRGRRILVNNNKLLRLKKRKIYDFEYRRRVKILVRKIVNVYDFLELFLLTVALFREKLLMMKPSRVDLSTKQSAVHHRAIAFNVKSLDMSLVEFPSRMTLTLTRRIHTAEV